MEIEYVVSENIDYIGFGKGPTSGQPMFTLKGFDEENVAQLERVNFPDDDALFIRFKRDGSCYRCDGATHATYAALLAAESKGKHYNAFIRNQFKDRITKLSTSFLVDTEATA